MSGFAGASPFPARAHEGGADQIDITVSGAGAIKSFNLGPLLTQSGHEKCLLEIRNYPI